jgi:hypothetical protein
MQKWLAKTDDARSRQAKDPARGAIDTLRLKPFELNISRKMESIRPASRSPQHRRVFELLEKLFEIRAEMTPLPRYLLVGHDYLDKKIPYTVTLR